MNRIFAALKLLPGLALVSGATAQTVINIDANSNRHTINPGIYGTAFPGSGQLADLNWTGARWGGNEASSYNWLQNCQAKGNDYYFESWTVDGSATAGEGEDSFIQSVMSAGAAPWVTVPMLTYVGKLGPNLATLWSYSVAKYGAQTGVDPYNSDAGNGISSSTGQPITTNDPTDANVANSLQMQQDWLTHMISTWGLSNAGGVKYYLMDNEPSLWSSTHQDVHPGGETLDEIYNDYVTYGSAVRATDPNAVIVGPEEWGWPGYFYSGADQDYANAHNWNGVFPDREAHGNMDYIPWLLQQLKNYQTTNGKQLINVLSVHYYPESGEFSDDDSANMQTIRNQSTRSLWDPNYTDISWIDSIVELIPRLKNWVSGYYPGLKTAITEYNWGDEGKMNGATAQADIMGIFGREGLDMAQRWTTPATNSPAYLAMKMFRNYDGNKSTFGDTSVSCSAPNPDYVSAFASQRTSDGALTVMLINKLTSVSSIQVNIANFGLPGSASGWQLSAPNGTASIEQTSALSLTSTGFSVSLPAQSVTVYVIPTSSSAISSLVLNPTSELGGGTATGTITMGSAAPSGGLKINLSSNTPSVVTLPSSVTVAGGTKTATFSIATKAYPENYNSVITASDTGSSTTATLHVTDDSITGLSLNPTSPLAGASSTGTITLFNAAPTGGWKVNLTDSLSSYVTVPSSVTVAAGATSATFPITTKSYGGSYTATITASDSISSKATNLTVQGDSIIGISLNPNPINSGASTTGTVTLHNAAPAGGWKVTLSNTLTSYVTIPSSVTVAAGATKATFSVTTKVYGGDYVSTITATDALSSQSINLGAYGDSVVTVTMNPRSVKGGATSTGTVTLHNAAPPGGWVVNLASNVSTYVGVPTSIKVPAGATSATFTATTAPYITTFSASITASDSLSKAVGVLSVTP